MCGATVICTRCKSDGALEAVFAHALARDVLSHARRINNIYRYAAAAEVAIKLIDGECLRCEERLDAELAAETKE